MDALVDSMDGLATDHKYLYRKEGGGIVEIKSIMVGFTSNVILLENMSLDIWRIALLNNHLRCHPHLTTNGGKSHSIRINLHKRCMLQLPSNV